MVRPPVIPPATPSLAQLARGTGAAVLCTTALLALTGASSVPLVALVVVVSLGLGMLAALGSGTGGQGDGGRVPATRDAADAAPRREPARR
ncbi:hypothetical protein [Streptomyces chilikensis]|uniref:hypothetical protein n=1 Tax=Streptomyces chilikensis TaxID=1194079 RepID=UPI00140A9A02|nr:hypothetical protein [Streptomyces chilikensis]